MRELSHAEMEAIGGGGVLGDIWKGAKKVAKGAANIVTGAAKDAWALVSNPKATAIGVLPLITLPALFIGGEIDGAAGVVKPGEFADSLESENSSTLRRRDPGSN